VKTWSSHQAVWKLAFKDFRVVFMLSDGDPPDKKTGLRPGRELARAVVDSVGWRAKVIECPEGQDVSSMVAAGKSDWFAAKLKADDDGDSD
jgi:hypothetical protein